MYKFAFFVSRSRRINKNAFKRICAKNVDYLQVCRICLKETIQHKEDSREDLIGFLTPHITGCSTFCCTRGKEIPAGNKHNEQLAILILWKFINPMLNGYAATQSDLQTRAPVVGHNKIVNRKFNAHSK